MKQIRALLYTLPILMAFIFVGLGVAAQQHNFSQPVVGLPSPVDIPATERQAIIDAYRAVESANKDFQIALLKARLACKVDESWPIDLQTMKFSPPKPAAPAQPPAKP